MSKAQLFQKIHKVMQDIEYLQKDDKVSMGQSGGYKAISEEKVTMTVRESLIKNGLVILPVEQEHHREGNLSTVNTKYEIIDIETGESKIIVSSGTGADTQDKGVGKAMTYSYKYLLLRTFAIPTGEDPDKVSSYDLDEQQKKSAASQDKPQSPSTDIPPSSLKNKYQVGKGSMDGFNEWVKEMQEKGFNFKSMDDSLTKALLKKNQEAKGVNQA